MSTEPINWVEKLVDSTWALVLLGLGGFAALVRRVFTHEARLKALEESRSTNARKLETIEGKIDANQDRVVNAIDNLRQKVDDDHRQVVSALLERVPRQ